MAKHYKRVLILSQALFLSITRVQMLPMFKSRFRKASIHAALETHFACPAFLA